MKCLKRVIQIMDDIISSNPGGEDVESYMEQVRNCHPFVFDRSGDGMSELDYSEWVENIDAPFSTFSIELLDGPLTSMDMADYKSTGCDVRIWCIVAIELGPTDYSFLQLLENLDKDGTSQWTVIPSDYSDRGGEGEPVYRFAINLVQEYLQRLARHKVGIEKVNERVRLKSKNPKKKKYHTIQNVVHVSNQSKSRKSDPSYAGIKGVINWSHQWSVRGHWRRTKGLGKDRAGDYTVANFTWVKSHVKGDGDEINKTRIVKG